MAIFGAGGIAAMPNQIADGIVDQVQSGSAVGVLSQQKAMRFGETSIVTFENRPKAEFVDEGVQKSSTTGSFGVVKTRTPQDAGHHALQPGGAVGRLRLPARRHQQARLRGCQALSRALDLGLFYCLNPLTGKPIKAWTNYLNKTTKRVARTASPDTDIETAIGLILNDKEGWDVNGIA